VALAGWLLPGLGYVLIGQWARGVIVGVTILLTFVLGLLIGGVRVIDVPGYDTDGSARYVNTQSGPVWALRARPPAEIFAKPWYIAQSIVGPVNWLATYGSIRVAAAGHPAATARVYDIGTLYTAVAGMLNLLVIIDAAYRSTKVKVPAKSASAPAGGAA